jgi:DHHC palmitoyltransferase
MAKILLRYKKKSSCKKNLYAIASFLIPTICLLELIFSKNFMNLSFNIIIFIPVYTFSLFFKFLCVLLYPMDRGVASKIKTKQSDLNFFTKYCKICKSYTSNESKHCTACKVCIEGYDHHCDWLGTCIGNKNYKVFVAFLAFSLGSFVVQARIFLEVIRACWGNGRELLVPVGFLVVSVGIAGFKAFVLSFHLFLCFKGARSYEYSKNKNKSSAKVKHVKVPSDTAKQKDDSVQPWSRVCRTQSQKVIRRKRSYSI